MCTLNQHCDPHGARFHVSVNQIFWVGCMRRVHLTSLSTTDRPSNAGAWFQRHQLHVLRKRSLHRHLVLTCADVTQAGLLHCLRCGAPATWILELLCRSLTGQEVVWICPFHPRSGTRLVFNMINSQFNILFLYTLMCKAGYGKKSCWAFEVLEYAKEIIKNNQVILRGSSGFCIEWATSSTSCSLAPLWTCTRSAADTTNTTE